MSHNADVEPHVSTVSYVKLSAWCITIFTFKLNPQALSHLKYQELFSSRYHSTQNKKFPVGHCYLCSRCGFSLRLIMQIRVMTSWGLLTYYWWSLQHFTKVNKQAKHKSLWCKKLGGSWCDSRLSVSNMKTASEINTATNENPHSRPCQESPRTIRKNIASQEWLFWAQRNYPGTKLRP